MNCPKCGGELTTTSIESVLACENMYKREKPDDDQPKCDYFGPAPTEAEQQR